MIQTKKPSFVSPHVLAESLAVVSAGEVKMSVEVEVIRRQLGHPQDRPLTLLFDGSHVIRLLRLPHQSFLQTGDHFTLGVDVLGDEEEESMTCDSRQTKFYHQSK